MICKKIHCITERFGMRSIKPHTVGDFGVIKLTRVGDTRTDGKSTYDISFGNGRTVRVHNVIEESFSIEEKKEK